MTQGRSNNNPTCTWSIPGFPRPLKNRFLALAKSQNQTGSTFMQYVVARTLREEREKMKKEMSRDA